MDVFLEFLENWGAGISDYENQQTVDVETHVSSPALGGSVKYILVFCAEKAMFTSYLSQKATWCEESTAVCGNPCLCQTVHILFLCVCFV